MIFMNPIFYILYIYIIQSKIFQTIINISPGTSNQQQVHSIQRIDSSTLHYVRYKVLLKLSFVKWIGRGIQVLSTMAAMANAPAWSRIGRVFGYRSLSEILFDPTVQPRGRPPWFVRDKRKNLPRNCSTYVTP